MIVTGNIFFIFFLHFQQSQAQMLPFTLSVFSSKDKTAQLDFSCHHLSLFADDILLYIDDAPTSILQVLDTFKEWSALLR